MLALLAESEEERQQLVQLVFDKSNGNCLWAALVVKELEDAVSKEQAYDILTSVPKEIGELCLPDLSERDGDAEEWNNCKSYLKMDTLFISSVTG
jgi:hypothetical protein